MSKEIFIVKPKTLAKLAEGNDIYGKLISIQAKDDGSAEVAINTADRPKLPEPIFDREMQAIANIEYLLTQFSGETRKRILGFVEARLTGVG